MLYFLQMFLRQCCCYGQKIITGLIVTGDKLTAGGMESIKIRNLGLVTSVNDTLSPVIPTPANNLKPVNTGEQIMTLAINTKLRTDMWKNL